MATVTEDVIAGSRCTWSEAGWTDKRILKVQGLSRTPASSIRYRAIIAAASNGAVMWAAHPTIPGLIANFIDAEPVPQNKTDIYVSVSYFDASVITIKVNGNVVQQVTRFDFEGKVLFTRYLPGAKPTFYGDKNQKDGFEQPVEVPVLRPGMTLEYEYFSTKIGNINPRAVTGKLNLKDWNGGAPHTWICTDCSPQWSVLTGTKILKRYHVGFLYQGFTPSGGAVRNSHDVVLEYRNPHTRNIPTEIDPKAGGYPTKKDGNGWKVAVLNESFDFNRLGLPRAIDN